MLWTIEEEGRRAIANKTGGAVPVKKQRGRQKTRWKDKCNRDMEIVAAWAGGEMDGTKWKNAI